MAKIPNDLHNYNPDEPFEGLGLIGWLKVVFRTRAQTLKQCDAMTHRMLLQTIDAERRAVGAEKLAKLVIIQAGAIKNAHAAMIDEGWDDMDHKNFDVFQHVEFAFNAGKQPL